MQSFAAFFLAIMTFLSSLFSVFSAVPKNTVTVDDSFVPVLRFVASSDSHINALGDKGCRRLQKMINTGYEVAKDDKNYSRLDAAVMCGDVTDRGTKSAFVAFSASAAAVIKEETEFMAVIAKSHDSTTLGRNSLEYFNSLTGQPTDFHKVINGFHFIGVSVSPDKSVHYSQAQIDWLDAEIAKAVEASPEKPVFVFQHEHILNTVFGSTEQDGWGEKYFAETLSKYPQVIDISGHSHYPANDPRSIWQGAFTAINDGGLAYYEFTVDGETAVHPSGNGSMAQMLLVEVDAQNRVKVRVCDLTAGNVCAEYLIDNVTETAKTKYSHTVRAAASAPAFTEGSKATVKTVLGSTVITAPPAKTGSDDAVYLYRTKVCDKNGNTLAAQTQLSDYYYELNPKQVEIKINKLLKSGTYTVYITAESVWGKQSTPLTAEFTIK